MNPIQGSIAPPGPSSRCYHLTSRGRACVDVVEAGRQTVGSLSLYLHDLLRTCGSAAWHEELRRSMPPRPLEESLQALMVLGLIERNWAD